MTVATLVVVFFLFGVTATTVLRLDCTLWWYQIATVHKIKPGEKRPDNVRNRFYPLGTKKPHFLIQHQVP